MQKYFQMADTAPTKHTDGTDGENAGGNGRGAATAAPPLTGILVNRVLPLSPLREKVRRHDIILSIDGNAVASDGTVQFR